MSIDLAMAYEHIVRKANNDCGRYDTAGADADIFRHLNRVWAVGHDGKYMSSVEDRYFALGTVSAYLRDSLERIIKTTAYSEEDNQKLQSIYDSLSEASLKDVDKAVVDSIEILK